MTKTGAITVLAHGASLVFAQFVVARMAPGAVRLECRETPDDGLGVTFMAYPAGRTCGMVERLVAEHRVLEVGWHPGGRGVAIGTLLRSQEVSCRFASRHDAVVAARTRTQHLRVVDADHRYPRARAMAVFTHVGGARMRGALARGIDTVVTAKAVAENVGVIKVRRQPGHSCMAVVAVVATGDVGRMFAGCSYAVMAAVAGTDDLDMVDRGDRGPGVDAMTILADIGCLHVRLPLAGCIAAIMTAGAITDDGGVVHGGRGPADGAVTVVAGVATGHMRGVLAGGR